MRVVSLLVLVISIFAAQIYGIEIVAKIFGGINVAKKIAGETGYYFVGPGWRVFDAPTYLPSPVFLVAGVDVLAVAARGVRKSTPIDGFDKRASRKRRGGRSGVVTSRDVDAGV
ncbi:hypothetical protein WA026_005685 [Henosepilachna vigintioctopunctata]|uniref:Uncharacterized protein n=1 Tax=Henosepilachna vigintioctopunctata TaxID=420089 RepID=A0AAW1TTH6_9CUCU